MLKISLTFIIVSRIEKNLRLNLGFVLYIKDACIIYMKKVIDLKRIISIINKIYENTSNVKILQDELEELLAVIDKTNLEYNRGKISKEIFDRDQKKFKKESVRFIKSINKFVNSDLNALNFINNTLNPPKTVKNESKTISQSIEVTTQPDQQLVNNVGNDGNKQN
jgi:hypothetical protein